MSKKPNRATVKQELDRKYVKQLDAGDEQGLRSLYAHYRDTCIDGGGSPAWARATSVLVLELLDRLEKLDPKKFYKGFYVGEKVALTDTIEWQGTILPAGTEGVIVSSYTPEEKIWDFDVIFEVEALGSTPIYVDADELRKVEE